MQRIAMVGVLLFLVATYLFVWLHELIVCIVHRKAGRGLLELSILGPGSNVAVHTVFGVPVAAHGVLPLFPMAMVKKADGKIRGGLWYLVYSIFLGSFEPTEQQRRESGTSAVKNSLQVLLLFTLCFATLQLLTLLIGLGRATLPGPRLPVTVESSENTEALKPGDIIHAINGKEIESALTIAELDTEPVAINALRSGREFTVILPGNSFTVERGGYRMHFSELLSVVGMLTVDAYNKDPVRVRHFAMLMIDNGGAGLSHYFQLLSQLQTMLVAFVLIILTEGVRIAPLPAEPHPAKTTR